MAGAGIDPRKQLFSLIRDAATETSQGERRVVSQKKQIEEVRSQLEAANVELEDEKRFKEATEQQLKSYEAELERHEATIHAVETRTSLVQDAVSTVGGEVELIKTKEAAMRDQFIQQMIEFNSQIREFLKAQASESHEEGDAELVEEDNQSTEEVAEHTSRNIEGMLADMTLQTVSEEEELLIERNLLKQLQLELIELKSQASLMEMIMEDTEAFQILTRQTSELEQACASLGDELQQRLVCPSCHSDNTDTLAGLLNANEAA